MKKGEIQVIIAEKKSEGSGAKVLRPFPGREIEHVDPFVLMDHFFVDPSASFPEHPHRGFEAVTYMLEGGFVHHDTGGHKATVEQGGLQRITMGKGIRHSEAPATEGLTRGIQLWVNLPKALKDIEPGYEIVPVEQIPVEERDGATIRTLVNDDIGPDLRTSIEYLDVVLSGKEFDWQVPAARSGFVYVIAGEGYFSYRGEETEMEHGKAIVKRNEENTEITLIAQDRLRFISAVGRPHEEPIDMHGSFVD